MTDFSTDPARTLARLSFWAPAARLADLEAAYASRLGPLLKKHDLVESAERGRPTAEGIFSRLFEMEGPAEVVAKRKALKVDPDWQRALLELGAAFCSEDGLLAWHWGIYSTPAGRGKVVEAGPGFRQGLWQSFGVQDGFPPVSVTALLQDRQGRLWLGTGRVGLNEDKEEGAGAVCYDGVQVVAFTTADGLIGNTVVSMGEDGQGTLWFGTEGGVSRYDGQRFTTFTTQDGLADNMVLSIGEDGQGNLWFGTWGGGVSRYDGQRFTTFTTQDGLAHNRVPSILRDSQGNLWFGTRGGGVSRYDGQGFTTFTTKDGLANDMVVNIGEDGQGDLWFGTRGGGVSRYDGKTWTTFTTADGLKSEVALAIVKDREGGLWFGALGGGTTRYDDQHLLSLTTREGLADNWLSSIFEDRHSHLWVGGNKGLNRYDGKTWTLFTTQDGLGRNTVWSILEDREGQLWFGTWYGGVSRYDGKTFTTFTTQDGLAGNKVLSMLQDREGPLWFGTDGGVSRYDGQHFKNFTTQDGLASNDVWAVLEDGRRNLWFGTDGGVSRYDGQGFTTFTTQEGLAHNQVRSMLRDGQGNLWFGTWGGGVSRYDGQQFKNFTTQNGLTSNNVGSILEDRRGHLWFGTWGGGVSVYDGLVFQTLLKEDGLAHDAVHKLIQARNGDIWIPTEGGATRYRPTQNPPTIRLANVIADRSYGPVSQLRLPSSQDYLRIEFLGANLQTSSRRMMYVYRLEGYDEAWRPTREAWVEYTDLPLGEYTFQVRAVDRDLNYSEPAAVRLTVVPDPRDERIDELEQRVQERTRELEETHQRLQETQAKLIAELEDELQTAHEMQMALMPKEPPQIQGFEITGRCTPANHVGGDLFQYFQQDGKLSVALADVTGHAMAAAIPVVMFSGVLKTEMKYGPALERLFASLNQTLCESLEARTFICFVLGELELPSRILRLSNSGCPYPYHYRAASGGVTELQVDAYPLGVRPDTSYRTIEVQLGPGDRVVFCSDGIIEATNHVGEMFGFERTAETVRRGCAEDLSAEALLARIIQEVKGFRGETPQGDDQTVVVLKVDDRRSA